MTTPKKMTPEELAQVDERLEQAAQVEKYGPGPTFGSGWLSDLRQHIAALEQELAAAESRGYERAREQAAALVQRTPLPIHTAEGTRMAQRLMDVVARIRAMTDERARGEAETKHDVCAACLRPIEMRRDGRWHHVGREPGGHYARPR